jgi:hypothetical protein
VAIVIMFLIRGQTSLGVPYYGIGVFMPIMVMGLAIRQHMKKHFTGHARRWGMVGATTAAVLSGIVFVGQVAGKWAEGGWVVLISFSLLAITAHLLLLSPIGYRDPHQIHRIVVQKARVQGTMASIVEWQSLRMQEYRYHLLGMIAHFWGMFGVRAPDRFYLAPLVASGNYDDAVHHDRPEEPSYLTRLLTPEPIGPHLGGAPNQTEPGTDALRG